MKSEQEIIRTPLNQNDKLARIIYENIFARDHRGTYRGWNTATYQAPETPEGFAYRLSLSVANAIRDELGMLL